MGGKLRPIGLITGLAGAGLTAYALFTLLASPSCIPGMHFGGHETQLLSLWIPRHSPDPTPPRFVMFSMPMSKLMAFH
ncbi:MAG: hypothetical protein QOJ04_2182 [Caballeronia sp.]|jgi:hypothetical protein|nr:hypothetical protein [Caballeronia sp.]